MNLSETENLVIPYLLNDVRECDKCFGDYMLCDVSPNDFLSLIYYAKYIYTDSFHALCFSYIFQKEFIVVDRDTRIDMSSRIIDILHTLNLENRRALCAEDLDRISLDKIDYSGGFLEYQKIRKESADYLNMILSCQV